MGIPTIVETWQVTGNPKVDKLDIAYTDSVYVTAEARDGLRRYMAAFYGCMLVKLLGIREIEYNGE
jgi:hypothetical protein